MVKTGIPHVICCVESLVSQNHFKIMMVSALLRRFPNHPYETWVVALGYWLFAFAGALLQFACET